MPSLWLRSSLSFGLNARCHCAALRDSPIRPLGKDPSASSSRFTSFMVAGRPPQRRFQQSNASSLAPTTSDPPTSGYPIPPNKQFLNMAALRATGSEWIFQEFYSHVFGLTQVAIVSCHRCMPVAVGSGSWPAHFFTPSPGKN